MNRHQLSIAGVLGCSLFASSMAFAMPQAQVTQTHAHPPTHQMHHQHRNMGYRHLSPAKRAEVRTMRRAHYTQIAPLIQNRRVLEMQLNGRLVTPGMQLAELNGLVEQINRNDAKLRQINTHARFNLYQKTGILMHGHHHACR